jgi:hypothetical protein
MRVRDPHQLNTVFNLLIGGRDYTEFVDEGGVTMNSANDLVTWVTFTLLDGVNVMDTIHARQKVELYAGSTDANNQKAMFRGVIRKIDGVYPVGGDIAATVECMSLAWQGAVKPLTCFYPQTKCIRPPFDKESCTLKEIVEWILNNVFTDFDKNIQIPTNAENIRFTKKNPFVQKMCTDWAALRKLAAIANCTLYETCTDTRNVINFVPITASALQADAAFSSSSDEITFRYVGRKGISGNGYSGQYEFSGNNKGDLWLDNNSQIELESLTMEIDPDIGAGQSIRIVTDFSGDPDDPDGGNSKIYFIKTSEADIKQWVAYEINKEKLASTSGLVQDELFRRIRNEYSGGEEVSWEDIEPYLRPVNWEGQHGYESNMPNKEFKDLPVWLGYKINARWIGDVNVQPYKTYLIYGIGKYSSAPSKQSGAGGTGRYYLDGLTHVFTKEGYFSEGHFIR